MTEQSPADPAPAATETAGRAFAALFRAIKVVRPVRPIHPDGVGLVGELIRGGTPAEGSGLDWLDSPGRDTVEARFSRSVGLPQAFPDILGLGLRVRTTGGEGLPGAASDVLFATTGWSFPARFLLVPRLDVAAATLTTLMPYRGRLGPVLLGLKTEQLPDGRGSNTGRKTKADGSFQESLATGDWVLGLYYAKPSGQWIRAGELRLRAATEPADTALRFNPLTNPLADGGTYPWTRRLRESSYQAAQRPAPASAKAAAPAPARAAAQASQRMNATVSANPSGRKTMSTVSRLFNSPADVVWKVIADGWLYSGWVVGASRIRAVDAHWPEADSRLHHSVGAWPLVINDSTRVAAVEPGRSLELVARGWPLGEAKVVITLEDLGTQCRVTIAEDAIRGPGKMVPKVLRDPLIAVRNRETLSRLELMAAGGAGS
ncbi:SRPBCC family protein [Arthrobacter sp. B6]|uniref:SRPBCC family protein n=1 Tax=Arthrobacter sp. B6 TaxID=1570137 RepID=UPI001E501251|nr:SRPBCC family protein [Arthrobacter sp. B6]